MTAKNGEKRVLVAMSGGVDSAVAAVLLFQQGYQVEGVHLRLWREASEDGPAELDMAQAFARQAASALGMNLHVIDAAQEFRQQVVSPFIRDYLCGLTPNPCFRCNQSFRWHLFARLADEYGIPMIATGHYARLIRGENGSVEVHKGCDSGKDQSYVLAGLNQSLLERTLLPLGELSKIDVRRIAEEKSLRVANRKDSQDICFLGDMDYQVFLRRHAPEVVKPGPIVSVQGETLGEHEGLAFYTVGQRKGIRVAAGKPYYVVEKRLQDNTLVVDHGDNAGKRSMKLGAMNWISGLPPESHFRGEVKIRYRSAFHPAAIWACGDGTTEVQFDQPLRDITPGQIGVIYDGDQVLGGGVIQSSQ